MRNKLPSGGIMDIFFVTPYPKFREQKLSVDISWPLTVIWPQGRKN